jgi:hypothetical protein
LIVQQSDGDRELDTDATKVEEADDSLDQGPDANPDEPGHQDADESE